MLVDYLYLTRILEDNPDALLRQRAFAFGFAGPSAYGGWFSSNTNAVSFPFDFNFYY
jgi:hypothetical protein